jgi:hypothetical protein
MAGIGTATTGSHNVLRHLQLRRVLGLTRLNVWPAEIFEGYGYLYSEKSSRASFRVFRQMSTRGLDFCPEGAAYNSPRSLRFARRHPGDRATKTEPVLALKGLHKICHGHDYAANPKHGPHQNRDYVSAKKEILLLK